jgi:tRNA U34 2-thiouridine synthase MnmA/TrmU
MRALAVFSGGLDSMLASQIMRVQGIDVLALFFETPFFPSDRAVESARSMDLPLKVIDITERHLELIKDPKHGYGENMNPCIDCHTLMVRTTGELLEKEGGRFIVTGEVLGQRPMSQNVQALTTVALESGFGGLVLRPLSAKRLPITIPEQRGWVDREKLMDFTGRSRKPQIALAKDLNIQGYPSPAGGCLLTDKVFSRRLRDLLENDQGNEKREIELLKVGRHFRVDPHVKLIVGRNRQENQLIETLSGEGDILLKTLSVPGPTVLIQGELKEEVETLAASMTVSYSDADDNHLTDVRMKGLGRDKVLKAQGRNKEEFKPYLI